MWSIKQLEVAEDQVARYNTTVHGNRWQTRPSRLLTASGTRPSDNLLCDAGQKGAKAVFELLWEDGGNQGSLDRPNANLASIWSA